MSILGYPERSKGAFEARSPKALNSSSRMRGRVLLVIAILCLLRALKYLDYVILSRYERSWVPPPSSISDLTEVRGRDIFQPAFLSDCTPSTPFYYAPCFAKTLQNVAHAEELIYPGFKLHSPIFASSRKADNDSWRHSINTIWERGYEAFGSVIYPEQHGQIIVFENMTIQDSTPFDKWVYEACSGTKATVTHLKPHDRSVPTHERALIVNTADSNSLQHFVDRASHVYLQAAHHQPQTIVTGRKDQKTADELWSALGFSPDDVLHEQTDITASTMIWSCRVPTFHPWLTRKFVNTIVPKSYGGPTPISERKVVMYMTRSNGRTRNPGRRITNEDKLLAEVQQLLDERDQGETLQIFDHGNFPETINLVQYFARNVRAIIGPHGGALHHHLWTGVDTLVVEMQPVAAPNLAFFETVTALDQQYAVLMLDTVNEQMDMEADIPAVLEILDERLGTELPASVRLTTYYHWRASELSPANDLRIE